MAGAAGGCGPTPLLAQPCRHVPPQSLLAQSQIVVVFSVEDDCVCSFFALKISTT